MVYNEIKDNQPTGKDLVQCDYCDTLEAPINEHPIEDERLREQRKKEEYQMCQLQQLPHREGIHHQLKSVDDIINQ